MDSILEESFQELFETLHTIVVHDEFTSMQLFIEGDQLKDSKYLTMNNYTCMNRYTNNHVFDRNRFYLVSILDRWIEHKNIDNSNKIITCIDSFRFYIRQVTDMNTLLLMFDFMHNLIYRLE